MPGNTPKQFPSAGHVPPRSALFYSTNRDWSWGAPDYVWPLAAQRLLEQGIPVAAVIHPQAFERDEIKRLQQAGAQVIAHPPLGFTRGRLGALRLKLQRWHPLERQMQRVLARLKQSHVFVNQGGSFDILDETSLLPWLQTTPACSYDLFFRSNQYGAPLPAARRQEAARLFGQARRCLFNSSWMRELTETQVLQRLPNAEIFPHLIRFPYEEPLPWPETHADKSIRIASVSRIDVHHKGLDVLLQALALLPVGLPPWTFDFYGRGPDLDYLVKLADWLQLSPRVKFHPYTDDIRQVWRDHHLLVLTSRYEGLAVSMLEAMACGRPVMRTPYGGFREWLIPGETGYACPAPEPGLIAGVLAQAMVEHAKWPAMGRAAFDHLRAHLPRDPWQCYLTPFASA